MKICPGCGKAKEESEFYLKRGKLYQCKQCRNEYHRKWYSENQQAHLARVRDYKQRHKHRIRADKYGITEQELLTGMAGCCKICSEPAEVVDHDHETGKFRGFLCNKCNMGLGHFDGDREKLLSAIKYLKLGT
jgi:hypothetical protein